MKHFIYIFYIKTHPYSLLFYSIFQFTKQNVFFVSFVPLFFQTPLWCKHLCTSLKAFVIKLKHTKNQQFMNTSNASLIRYIFITMFMYEGSDFIWDTLYWNILLILAEIKHKCQHWYYRMAALVVDSFSLVSIFFVFDFFLENRWLLFFFLHWLHFEVFCSILRAFSDNNQVLSTNLYYLYYHYHWEDGGKRNVR